MFGVDLVCLLYVWRSRTFDWFGFRFGWLVFVYGFVLVVLFLVLVLWCLRNCCCVEFCRLMFCDGLIGVLGYGLICVGSFLGCLDVINSAVGVDYCWFREFVVGCWCFSLFSCSLGVVVLWFWLFVPWVVLLLFVFGLHRVV